MSDCKLRCRCCRLRCCYLLVLWNEFVNNIMTLSSSTFAFRFFDTIRQISIVVHTTLVYHSNSRFSDFDIKLWILFTSKSIFHSTNDVVATIQIPMQFKSISFHDKAKTLKLCASDFQSWKLTVAKQRKSNRTELSSIEMFQDFQSFEYIVNGFRLLNLPKREGEKNTPMSFDILLFHALIVLGIMFSRLQLLFTFSYRRWREWHDRHTANTCKYSDLLAIYLQA